MLLRKVTWKIFCTANTLSGVQRNLCFTWQTWIMLHVGIQLVWWCGQKGWYLWQELGYGLEIGGISVPQ